MLAKQPLTDVLDAFSSSAPTPGGGSAAALAGALGASLLAMVAALPKTKTNAPEERASLDAARAKIVEFRNKLIDLIDRDADAYDGVVEAYRLPKGTDTEKAARKTAIQAALKLASEVPLETFLVTIEVMRAAATVAEAGNLSARTDIAVAIQLLQTASQGAVFNIEANLGSVTEQAFVEGIVRQVKAAYEVRNDAMMRTHQSAGVMDLFKQIMTRFGSPHGHGSVDPPKDVWIRAAVETLKRLGTADARSALEKLSESADEMTARQAREGLAAFGSSP
jgi:formiminotetrahydrofolate cyclodeaminase